jgi:hypothetical protein
VRVKNLFRRAKIRDDFFQNITVFTKYTIKGEERPEQIAEKVYGSSSYDWIVLISNNILNVRTEWPMSDYEFQNYLSRKYTEEELYATHHYETITYYDKNGKLIVPSGKEVDPDFSVTYYDSEESTIPSPCYDLSNTALKLDSNLVKLDQRCVELKTGNSMTINPVKAISNYEYESKLNDAKRNIYLLRTRYLQTAIDDMREIMSYGFSSQYINDLTKRGDNLRLISPR